MPPGCWKGARRSQPAVSVLPSRGEDTGPRRPTIRRVADLSPVYRHIPGRVEWPLPCPAPHGVTTINLSPIKPFAAIAIAMLLSVPAGAGAQTTNIATPPPNVLLPNANGVPPGQTANLEGGAYVARADDSSSNWYNPAGLARASTSSVSATGGAYQGTTVKMSAFPDAGGSFTHLPAVVGAVFKPQKGTSAWTFGFSVIQSNYWDNAIATQLVHLRRTYAGALRLHRRLAVLTCPGQPRRRARFFRMEIRVRAGRGIHQPREGSDGERHPSDPDRPVVVRRQLALHRRGGPPAPQRGSPARPLEGMEARRHASIAGRGDLLVRALPRSTAWRRRGHRTCP